jgi:hypothetical protein
MDHRIGDPKKAMGLHFPTLLCVGAATPIASDAAFSRSEFGPQMCPQNDNQTRIATGNAPARLSDMLMPPDSRFLPAEKEQHGHG